MKFIIIHKNKILNMIYFFCVLYPFPFVLYLFRIPNQLF